MINTEQRSSTRRAVSRPSVDTPTLQCVKTAKPFRYCHYITYLFFLDSIVLHSLDLREHLKSES